jgi:creatinine amidohydrolase/Fe(II)-dependent formamide hydrolase-like protein
VGDLAKVEPAEFGVPFEPACRGWVTQDRSAVGHIGDPRPANADKGETLFRVFSDDVTQFLERVIRWDGTSWSG